MLDCDGVLYRGEAVVPGVPEMLAALRAAGKRVCFITNNSTRSRVHYVAKFKAMEIAAEPMRGSGRTTLR